MNTSEKSFKVRVGSLTTTYDVDRDLHIELELRNEFTPYVLPQLHFRRTERTIPLSAVAADRSALEDLITYIDQHVSAGTFPTVHHFYGLPDGTPTMSSAIVLQRRNQGYIRYGSPGDEAWLLPELAASWTSTLRAGLLGSTEVRKSTENAEVRINFHYNPNTTYRAVAKIAFNMFSYKRGTNLALRAELDPLRNYINGDLQLPATARPDEVAVDPRFVRELEPLEQQLSFAVDDHAVVFYYRKPELIAFVTLYGTHMFCVKFPPMLYDEAEELFGHGFSIDRTGNEDLSFQAIAERILKNNRTTLGLTEQQVQDALAHLHAL
jgi:hypothetical protein